jgi:hypothetical protein
MAVEHVDDRLVRVVNIYDAVYVPHLKTIIHGEQDAEKIRRLLRAFKFSLDAQSARKTIIVDFPAT